MGRVGDSPLVGAGAYADNNTGAVSATGWGEPIILACLSKRVLEFIERGMGPTEASETALKEMLRCLEALHERVVAPVSCGWTS